VCIQAARKIKQHTSFEGTITSSHVVNSYTILSKLSGVEKTYGYFTQDNSTAHTANFSITALQHLLLKELVTQITASLTSGFELMSLLFMGTLKAFMYVNNPNSLQEWKGNMERQTANISRNYFRHVSRNIIRRCKVCLETASHHFETLL
jgi:hypothetical protein